MGKPTLIEVQPGEWAEIVKGKYIRLFGARQRWVANEKTVHLYENKFVLGDIAEYDSFNLSYTAEIVSITDKTVTFKLRDGRKKRLKIATFQWRNWNFDAEETAQKNSETMMYI